MQDSRASIWPASATSSCTKGKARQNKKTGIKGVIPGKRLIKSETGIVLVGTAICFFQFSIKNSLRKFDKSGYKF